MIGKDLAALAVLVFTSGVIPSAGQAEALVEWETTLDKGLEAARANNRPVLLDFSAEWCAPCKAMDKSVWTDPELASVLPERVVPVRIDFDSEKRLAGRFKVQGIPTMIWMDPWGNELGRNLGFTDAPTLVSVIESLPDDFTPIASFQELVSRNAEHAPALVRIAAFYREKSLLIAADSFYKRALEATGKGKKDPLVAEQAYVGLGLSMLTRGNAKEARNFLEKATKLPAGPNRANALYGLVAAHAKLGEQKNATKRLEELRLAYPEYDQLASAEALVAGLKKP